MLTHMKSRLMADAQALPCTLWETSVSGCPRGLPAAAPWAWSGAHLLGRASGWHISSTQTAPGRLLLLPVPRGRLLVPGFPGPRPSRRSSRDACRGPSCPRGPAHTPLWGGGKDRQADRQTDGVSWQGVSLRSKGRVRAGQLPAAPSLHAETQAGQE